MQNLKSWHVYTLMCLWMYAWYVELMFHVWGSLNIIHVWHRERSSLTTASSLILRQHFIQILYNRNGEPCAIEGQQPAVNYSTQILHQLISLICALSGRGEDPISEVTCWGDWLNENLQTAGPPCHMVHHSCRLSMCTFERDIKKHSVVSISQC